MGLFKSKAEDVQRAENWADQRRRELGQTGFNEDGEATPERVEAARRWSESQRHAMQLRAELEKGGR